MAGTLMTAMVLCAGLGTRMAPADNGRPKPLVPVKGKALLDHALDRLATAGITRAVINVHHKADQIELHLRGRTAGQDYKTYILSLMFFKRLSDQWDHEATEKIADMERERGKPFTDAQRERLLASRDIHRFTLPDGCHWEDVRKVTARC